MESLTCPHCNETTWLRGNSLIVQFDTGRRRDYLRYKCTNCDQYSKELVTAEDKLALGEIGISTLSNPGDIEPEIDNYITSTVIDAPITVPEQPVEPIN